MTAVTVVLHRDGRLHLASDKITEADAVRWHESGYEVFRIEGVKMGVQDELVFIARNLGAQRAVETIASSIPHLTLKETRDVEGQAQEVRSEENPDPEGRELEAARREAQRRDPG